MLVPALALIVTVLGAVTAYRVGYGRGHADGHLDGYDDAILSGDVR